MASSPMSARGASPEILSPGAKVRALMATIDSSDDEILPGSNQKSKRQRLSFAKFGARMSDSADDDSDADIRPRGRLAARMQGNAVSGTIPQSSLPSNRGKDSEPRTSRHEEESTRPEPAVTEASTPRDDDEDEMPVARRRTTRNTVTPEPQVVAETSFDRPESPGLFVSSPPRPSPAHASHQELEFQNEGKQIRNDRFQKLVLQKRMEREKREAEEEARQAERLARQEKLHSEMDALDSDRNGDISDIAEDEDGHRLTQQNRPARKASKKAIEEMNRETQRMARNMQLAQQAKTRKRFETSGLLQRFGFKAADDTVLGPASSSRPATPETDSEMRDADTAPSSPPTAHKPEAVQQTPDEASPNNNDELPSVDDLALETPKTAAGNKEAQIRDPQVKTLNKPKRQIRVRVPFTNKRGANHDSDDELQVMPTFKDKINAVFDNVPLKRKQEPHSLQALRALAQVKSPGKETARRSNGKGMTPGELSTSLQAKARQQARLERDRHVEALKAQGVVIQTAEEREREIQEVESILARAREDDQQLMEEERAAAKKEAQENGTYDPLAWDDSEDDDYEGSAKGDADGEGEADDAIDLSGSEEEDDAADSGDEEAANVFFEDEADEEADDGASKREATETDNPLQAHIHRDEEDLPSINRRRGRNLKAVLSDDENDIVEATPKPAIAQRTSPTVPATDSPAAPGSVLRSAKKTFIPGLPVEGPAGLGLTQIFAGTMDDSQSQMTPGRAPTQSMMPDFDHFPDSNFSAKSDFKATTSQAEETQASTQGVKFSLSQMRKLDSLLRGPDTQGSELIEASQDGGFQEHTPLHDRFIEPPTSTIQTVVLDKADRSQIDSPLVQRGRYRRKLDIIEETKDSESAFDALRAGIEKEKLKQRQEEFDRKKSKAKEMVEEQADESEDEYAGLGGADGEDSDDESVASVKEMIDDAQGEDVDKAKIAAFYADRERAEDEQGIEKLYKDLTTGQLRRKRGADYDLSDSDDGGEAQRRRKRLQFAKMQKALFSDERVKKMAENPGNQAFLRTIEDQGDNGEANFLDVDEEPLQTQSDTATPPPDADAPEQTVPDSQPRKALGDTASNRAPASSRRTKDGKRPSNIGDVRQTLSSLLDERDMSVIPATQVESDSENEAPPSSARSDKENRTPNRRRGRVAVVDRINLKRNSSSGISASRLAFATNNTDSSSTGFKVPSFLRRTSTAASFGSSTISSTSAMTGGSFGDDGRIKKNASKKSGINAFSATNDVMSKIEKNEKKRQEKRFRGAERRLGAVGGLLSKGSFE